MFAYLGGFLTPVTTFSPSLCSSSGKNEALVGPITPAGTSGVIVVRYKNEAGFSLSLTLPTHSSLFSTISRHHDVPVVPSMS